MRKLIFINLIILIFYKIKEKMKKIFLLIFIKAVINEIDEE